MRILSVLLILMTAFASGSFPSIQALEKIPQIKVDRGETYPHENVLPEQEDDKVSIIIEVEGDPEEHKEYFTVNHPFVDVIATYDTLFKGLALQASPERFEKMKSLKFIKAIHPVRTYKAIGHPLEGKDKQPGAVIPSALNTTKYTGKGIKVGVVDTGIDYEHPDLAENYAGGYDLVDLDDDPMETRKEEGMPTLHGSHVAGIIGADGDLQGVAPDADLYAYRALGPGGRGTSIQVIAALEKAVKDGMDVINLSLGNSVNGPDYPTSIAVNRAAELGVFIVTANGNDGPENWTVGSPATAEKAISVGASSDPALIPFLHDQKQDKRIPLMKMIGSKPWQLEKDYLIVHTDDGRENVTGKIALIKRGRLPFYEQAKQAEDNGAVAIVIANNEKGLFQGSVENAENPVEIPVAAVSKADGDWLFKETDTGKTYLDTTYKETKVNIAPFSSRGPVTINWKIKPDIVAPGTNILSTVPGGYQELQGTSMAAPHVAGAIALMKEARPDWTNEQITGALKTTAIPIQDDKAENYDPIIQGTGKIRIDEAIQTDTIIHDPLLTFGKISRYKETETINLTVENTSNKRQKYTFNVPNKQKGYTWNLPQTFTLEKKQKKKIPVELSVTTPQLSEGLHQGSLTLHGQNETFQLPYLFVNKTADYPKAMGFEFSLKTFSDDVYMYKLYTTEPVKHAEVILYDPDTLLYERTLLKEENLKKGLNEGELEKKKAGKPGHYKALITLQMEDGTFESKETELLIE